MEILSGGIMRRLKSFTPSGRDDTSTETSRIGVNVPSVNPFLTLLS